MTRFYGGLINRLQEGATVREVPKVGDGATMYLYSDRHAYTVREVKVSPSGKTITIKATRDHAVRTDGGGFSESQTYDFTTVGEPEDGQTFKSVSGKPFRSVYWDHEANGYRMSETILRVGHRDEYYDFTK
jgi:hypothetical protein